MFKLDSLSTTNIITFKILQIQKLVSYIDRSSDAPRKNIAYIYASIVNAQIIFIEHHFCAVCRCAFCYSMMN